MKNLKTLLRYNLWLIGLIIFILFYCLILTKVIKYESKYSINETSISGTIISLSLNGNKLSFVIKGKEKVIANYYIKTEEEKENILNIVHLGDKINLNGEFKAPSNNTIPNTFNYKNYLYNKKIYWTYTVNAFEIAKSNNMFYKVKDYLLKRSYKLKNSEYYLVFILGDKSLMSSEDYNNYQTNGVSHLLAISGMHIGVLLSLLSIFIKNFSEKKQVAIISLILLFFLFITSFSASVLRAALFYILNKLNKIFNLKLHSIQLLLITACIILFLNPFMLYDLGFIYSFIVCFGIIYYGDKINGNYIIKLFKLSIVSFLFSLPITAYLNYEINLFQIFSNLLFVPFISLIVYPLSLITFIMPLFTPVLSFLISITKYLNIFISNFKIIINIPKISIILIFVYYVILLIAKNKKKFYFGIAFIIILAKLMPLFNSDYQIYYLDIGQGDSAVLISPHKSEVVMIDTGGKITYEQETWKESSKSYNLSDNTIKFLKSKGIIRVDYLILSHGDADHAGEAINIINNLKVKNVVLNIGDYNYLESKIINTKVNITNEYKLKYFNITNLNNVDYNDENQNSIISYITFEKYKLLFMGDATVKQESAILKKYNLKNIDFLKVGHHGSDTSSSKYFIDYLRPKYSIISVGRNNRYSHPKQSVLDTLRNTQIYRTDQDGTIEIKLNKSKYKINEYMP